ncbi:MAG: ABC transporter ATP-binding protein [Chlamydiae bacterium]|nr:ABC transporter ATP-binding protein [Chlamydiota bacterium]MBI3277705.1 ABC transporter ATP-binding protein [Chlamydiota bacterium]
MESILEACDLVKIYKNVWKRQKVVALDHLNLQVSRGEIFGLLGPNGSGKTTAMKAFLGLLRLNQGQVKVFNQKPNKIAIKSRIGFLPEESYLYKFLTAQESLEFYGKLAGLRSGHIRKEIPLVLQKVDLTHAKDRWVRSFSKGMLRRLGLAFILLKDPDLIFLDEPTVGLDPIGTLQVREMILDLKKRGKTIIMSSHLLGEIENVCDRVAILYQGKVLREDTLDALLEIPEKTQIVVDGTLDQEYLKKIFEELGITVDTVGRPRKTLERAFVETLRVPRP